MSKKEKILTKDEIIEIIRKEKQFLREKYNVSEIGLFGSYVRGEPNKRSDIDLLIGFSKIPDLFTYIDIMYYLKEKIGRKVDLVSRNALREEIKEHILNEVQYI